MVGHGPQTFVAPARYERYAPLADLRGRRDDDAEDTAQDALLAAWSKLDTFRCDCEFATWVHTIVTGWL